MQSEAGRTGYRVVGGAVRGGGAALVLWKLLVAAGVGTLVFVTGLVS
jgi:hypothetical protein